MREREGDRGRERERETGGEREGVEMERKKCCAFVCENDNERKRMNAKKEKERKKMKKERKSERKDKTIKRPREYERSKVNCTQ